MASITLIPSGYTGASNMSVSTSSNAISNAYSNTSSTTYAQMTPSSTSTTGYLYLTFDASAIPAGATITSVTAQAKLRINNTSRVTNCSVQLYTNTTAKGSSTSVTSTSSSNIQSLTPGTWTREELQNLRLRVNGRKGSSNQTGYIYFYGAEVTVNYTYITYNVTATSLVQDVSVSPSSEAVAEGDSITITFDVDDIDGYIVTDNDVDVTENLVRHQVQNEAQSATFIPSSFDSTNSVYNTTAGDSGNGIYSTNYIANGLTDHTSSTRCALYSVQGSGSQSYMYYNFDCSSIPQNVTINSVSCQFKGGSQGSSYYSSYVAQLTTGTTLKGSSTSVTGSNSSPSTVTINGGNSWTRAELNNIKIKFTVTRGSSNTTTDSTWSFFGATLTVNYTVNATASYYYTYTLNNVSAAHVILLDLAGVFIPPEEDPQLTYYPITISSINATTSPSTGTTRVVAGSNQTITITPSDPQLTLALDNGVDITSQLSGGIPNNTYTITTKVSGASYGFTLNSSTGYYVSQNAGQASSAAVARVNFTLESDCLVTIQYINYAEATYDYGIFGTPDSALGTTYSTDSNAYYSCSASSDNTSTAKTLTYELTAGTHFIDIKYRKDNYTDSNNDNLQWKILSVEATSAAGEYTYTLTNVQAKHSLIFVFGNVSYYYVTSSGPNNMKLFPDGQSVVLEGNNYKINIVPQNVTDLISLYDNNVNVTTYLEREDGYDKNNNPAVSYSYQLTNVTATHNLVFYATSDHFYIKQNSSWIEVSKIYLKVNGSWVEQDLNYLSTNNITQLRQG